MNPIERYLEQQYGPDWHLKRRGHTGECAYCSGKISTETSRALTEKYLAEGNHFRQPSCAEKKVIKNAKS